MEHRMTAGTALIHRPGPRPITGPIECEPWCECHDGHADSGFREDQRCETPELRIDLSLHPIVEESRYIEGKGWVYGPDHIKVHAEQQADQRYPRIVIRRETDGPVEQWYFTPGEAGQLLEAVELILGQIEGGATA